MTRAEQYRDIEFGLADVHAGEIQGVTSWCASLHTDAYLFDDGSALLKHDDSSEVTDAAGFEQFREQFA